MFDDPKRRLYELEEALKAAEYEDSLDVEEAEEPDWLQEAKDLLNESATEVLPIRNKANNYGKPSQEEIPIRNRANNYGRAPESADFPRMAYADEEMRQTDALFVEKPRRKGAGSLVFLALLELIGIGLVILWWLKWTL